MHRDNLSDSIHSVAIFNLRNITYSKDHPSFFLLAFFSIDKTQIGYHNQQNDEDCESKNIIALHATRAYYCHLPNSCTIAPVFISNRLNANTCVFNNYAYIEYNQIIRSAHFAMISRHVL